ncbi:hypothetical protein DM02DRAFT_731639 [Periconia macrospinosa]|uniref:PNPLA domain-containing protein n=1 Tax=Periconia macrospinosa TaxID=97972 RepID=A0A2V1DC67_9PLEO|nr:hypothetical protein DM02DRAFT_731639 [Periconia macrospinosa]
MPPTTAAEHPPPHGHGTAALDDLADTDYCEDCEEVLSDYYCNACAVNLCSSCWDTQPAHRRKRLAPGQIPHEKTNLTVANRVQTVFTCAGDERTLKRLHKEDEVTAWFGLERELKDEGLFMFRDHGRFADLANNHHSFNHQTPPVSTGTPLAVTNKIPSLVSFVGQTGAGKSTLIKLLIQLNQRPGPGEKFHSPVPGLTGRDLPTSEDVHLYADPLTAGSNHPLLFADSEGIDGGEREPLAANLRKTREKEEMESVGSESDYSATPRSFTEREVTWMDSKVKQTRQFAASQLYPRILFAFSDVVVFVHRNPRSIEGVLERLLDWGSVAIETTYNQPILPYAIVALNATELDIDPSMWDIETSTTLLLASLASTVDKNATFSTYAELWRKRGKVINNIEDLMMCYYSAVKVIRLPTNGRPILVEQQAQSLYAEIERACRLARNVKKQTRMLLNAFELQAYLHHAFDHFCSTLDTPFDFVQCSYLTSHLSTTFGESILALARSMALKKPRPRASTIFQKLGHLIASCMTLDVMRSNLKGTAERIFAQYVPQIDAALREFGDRHWPCEFYVRGAVPPHLQTHLNALHFQHSVHAVGVIMRCANVRSGHAAKGHQLSDGRVFARGAYESSFKFEEHRKQILDDIYVKFHQSMQKLSGLARQGVDQLKAAAVLHRTEALSAFYPATDGEETVGLQHTVFCICCLFGLPEALLPCGHMLCRDCVEAYGHRKAHALVEVLECPLEINQKTQQQPHIVYTRPESAGVRVLALHNGGVRSIIQIEVLKLIEKELQGKIPIKSLFDMIIGEGTGGVLALGLNARGWDLDDCEQHLREIFAKSFTPANIHRFPTFQLRGSQAKYRSKMLEDCLASIFPEQRIVDLPPSDDPMQRSSKVAVLTSSSTGRKILFSNYRRKASPTLPYTLYPVTDYASQPKVSDIARASMAHTELFKPFLDPRLGHLFFKKDMTERFLIEVAQNECQSIYTGLPKDFPDILLSIGCGRTRKASTPSINSTNTSQTKASSKPISHVEADETRSVFTEYSGDVSALYPRPNFISLNPALDAPPSLDNVSSIASLQSLIQSATDTMVIKKIVNQLFATLFYAESDTAIQDTAAGEYLIPIRIHTRIVSHTPTMHALGTLLQPTGPFPNSSFVFWEQDYAPQHFPISQHAIDSMVQQGRFPSLKILLPVWDVDAVVHGVLRLEGGEEYPLSAFPRCLLVGGQKLSRKGNLDISSLSKVPTWSAPAVEKDNDTDNDTNADVSSNEIGTGWTADFAIRAGHGDLDDDDDDDATALPKYTP